MPGVTGVSASLIVKRHKKRILSLSTRFPSADPKGREVDGRPARLQDRSPEVFRLCLHTSLRRTYVRCVVRVRPPTEEQGKKYVLCTKKERRREMSGRTSKLASTFYVPYWKTLDYYDVVRRGIWKTVGIFCFLGFWYIWFRDSNTCSRRRKKGKKSSVSYYYSERTEEQPLSTVITNKMSYRYSYGHYQERLLR
jgi:hypothetical protein